MTQIKDAVCIVTGAASGIGRQLAIQSASRGARRVLAADINLSELTETCRLAGRSNGQLESFGLDVGKPDEIHEFVNAVLPSLGKSRLVLFNNAGIGLCSGRFQDTPMEDFLRLLDVNLLGVLHMTRGFYDYLLAQGEGHVVNISSVFGLAGIDCQTAYCTSKFAVRGFTESLRMELSDSRVQVTCVHPGGIKTNIMRNTRPLGPTITSDHHDDLIKEFDKIARTTAEQAARQILNAVEKNKTRLVIGLDGKQLDWVTRLFPVGYTGIIQRMLKRTVTNPYGRTS
jgi:NAD(P)-dependent dehydrogenase (short-subunit alcohol dehydrogenase family)